VPVTIAGYSALLIAQALPSSSRLISIERDLTWVFTAKRFMWQASQGGGEKAIARIGDRVGGVRKKELYGA
jgi:predicted O-methyltransferase YrrM